jgi:hypothetical protein
MSHSSFCVFSVATLEMLSPVLLFLFLLLLLLLLLLLPGTWSFLRAQLALKAGARSRWAALTRKLLH